MPALAPHDFLPLVRMALAEDVGSGDVTTALTVPPGAVGTAVIRQKQAGTIFGHQVAEAVFFELDPTVEYARLREDGADCDEPPAEIARVAGPLAALLTGERTALNFLMHLSGVATAAAAAARAVEGTGCKVLDTRKTTPGMRLLEKAAVAAGGASNHRIGLHDAILVKENHIAAAGGVEAAVRACTTGSDLALEVEVRNGDEIDQALAAGARRLLLDNMSDDQLRAAVKQVSGRATLEASGGYRLDNLRSAAETGVDFISMGSITHGAPALDLSMVVEEV
ncbi:MAG: carboxylating nicotinate-nucleotide diphosphorylase [Actinobacteria bacterium]|nr:carboxylating nicotinate-nucleotide diphosphorylase [Actinomycetota bacterium]